MATSDTEDPTGIPTRAIHEAYLDMHRALKDYRRAQDRGTQQSKQAAHGEVQETVLTIFEMLRPHLKNNNVVEDFWHGKPPTYTHDQTPPDPIDGVAILAVQTHTETTQLNGVQLDNLDDFADWDEVLKLPEQGRITGVSIQDGVVVYQYQLYEMGLRKLDDWQTETKTVQSELGGFMSGRNTSQTTKRRVPIDKLKRAGRELSNAAQKLGALSEFNKSVPRTEITQEMIDEVDEWRKQNIQS